MFKEILENSITFVYNSSFTLSNLIYAKNQITPHCNTFPIFTNMNERNPPFDTFNHFVNSLAEGSTTTILATDSIDSLSQKFEQNFQDEFNNATNQNVKNFYSKISSRTQRKELEITTKLGLFDLQKFGLTDDGIIAIPEQLVPPYNLIEYAGLFFLDNNFIYISSNSSMSMKAALFVLANIDLYDSFLTKNNIVEIKYFYKMTDSEELKPYEWNVSVFPTTDIIDNVPLGPFGQGIL